MVQTAELNCVVERVETAERTTVEKRVKTRRAYVYQKGENCRTYMCGRESKDYRTYVQREYRLQNLHVWQRVGGCVEPNDEFEEPPDSNSRF